LTVTGGVSQDVLTNIAQAMFEKNSEETLQLFDVMVQNGKDPGRFVFDFIDFLRDVLFYKATPNLKDHLERAVVTESFERLTESVDVSWIQQAIVRLTECEQQIKWTTSPKVFVEVTLLMIASEQDNQQAQQVVATSAVSSDEMVQLTE